jgi:hypothetical protein
MTKMQKVWLGIFLAMFIIPELLWSPILSFGYELLQSGNTHPLRVNYLTSLDHKDLLIFILIFESIGLLSTFVFLMKTINKKTIGFWLAELLLFIFFLISLVVIYFFFAFSRGISF